MRNLEDLSHGEIQNLKEQLTDIQILDMVAQGDLITPTLLLLKTYALRNLGSTDEAIEILKELINSED